MSGPTRLRTAALALTALVAATLATTGLTATTGRAAAEGASTPDQAQAATRCGERDFCLYARPHQTGKILFKRTVTVDEETGTVDTVNEDLIAESIRPRSAKLPGLPEGLSCIADLFDKPHYDGDNQTVEYGYPLHVISLAELNGQPVRSINTDCG
ncbi:hypothetical protein ABZ816_39420 [Actinosynnema sp. NPDC047251]|uniref:Putative secreted protein n=1 Tax=Saccharothrix espanaensis (strain ATCC 51144 / DSM 44229 / JCM 9112 / NBRC 15066 / NRRL 15764) TaxID=1179773 RepID=K0JXN2_SACES|nr:hypothetical protein [Saccharothrix espanaensis]CCH28988.1 putative secreted protein [Saccharothrix espanaensis DSM 44229]